MDAVPHPNNTLASHCMSTAGGCNFLNGHHQQQGRCDHVHPSYICCVFTCEGDAEC